MVMHLEDIVASENLLLGVLLLVGLHESNEVRLHADLIERGGSDGGGEGDSLHHFESGGRVLQRKDNTSELTKKKERKDSLLARKRVRSGEN